MEAKEKDKLALFLKACKNVDEKWDKEKDEPKEEQTEE